MGRMEQKLSPDDILKELGGCGRYQIFLTVMIHMLKSLTTFSVLSMIVFAKTPVWYCDDQIDANSTTDLIDNNTDLLKSCFTANGTQCTKFRYEGMRTVVSEFDLVCDMAYVPATIMSIQTAGTLLGNVIAGQLADLYGRKPPIVASILILIASNVICIVSTNWIMFTVARFLIGVGAGFFLAIQYTILSEFTLSEWRSWVIGCPSWPIHACIFSLCAWLIQDWKYVMLFCALWGLPMLVPLWILPESFRWYMAHDRPHDAAKIVKSVARFNKHPESAQVKHVLASSVTATKDRKYTVRDLFRSWFLVRITLLSAINWLGLGLAYYGIAFGVQALSGNIFVNMVLFNLSGVPTKAIGMWLQNKIGRRKTAMLCYGVCATGGFIVGIVQYIDTPHKDALTNGFALFACIGANTAWGPVQTMTIELYPTVIRNIGFGSLNMIARGGAVLGPQLVFLNMFVPGLLYFVCGVISTISVFGLLGLPETRHANLSDKLESNHQDNTDETIKSALMNSKVNNVV